MHEVEAQNAPWAKKSAAAVVLPFTSTSQCSALPDGSIVCQFSFGNNIQVPPVEVLTLRGHCLFTCLAACVSHTQQTPTVSGAQGVRRGGACDTADACHCNCVATARVHACAAAIGQKEAGSFADAAVSRLTSSLLLLLLLLLLLALLLLLLRLWCGLLLVSSCCHVHVCCGLHTTAATPDGTAAAAWL